MELGALDGITYSNTIVLSGLLAWRGVLIEASPASFPSLVRNRPNDILIHAAICDTPTTVHFVEQKDKAVSGIYEFMAKSFLDVWHPSFNIDSAPRIPCFPLHSLLRMTGIRHFNLFSLDVEGGELAVLQSLDFTNVIFDVIVVEADSHNEKKNLSVRDLKKNRGYIFSDHIGSNDWFVRKSFSPRKC